MQSKVSPLRNSTVIRAALFATVLMLVPSLAGQTGATYGAAIDSEDECRLRLGARFVPSSHFCA
jgi:hypothetical protein